MVQAIDIAIINGNPGIVQILLDSGADLHAVAKKSGQPPLHLACGRRVRIATEGSYMARVWSEVGRHTTRECAVALIVGGRQGTRGALNRGRRRVGAGTHTQHSPIYHLHCLVLWPPPPRGQACWRGHVEVVKLLLKAGADPQMKNARGQTALEVSETSSVTRVHEQVAELLVQHVPTLKQRVQHAKREL